MDDVVDGEPPSEYDASVLSAGLGLVKTAKMLLSKSLKAIQVLVIRY